MYRQPFSTLVGTMAFFYPYHEILTIIGMILLLMTAPFHLTTKGISTWPFLLWSFIWCFLRTVNGFIWSNRTDNIAPLWCDICGSLWSLCRENYLTTNNLAGRLELGAMLGVAAGKVAINRRVYRITTGRSQISDASIYVRIAHH